MTFRDIRGPPSVGRADPAALDKSFGAGATLKQVEVDVAEDPAPTGIENCFAWSADYRDRHFDENRLFRHGENMSDHARAF